MTGLGWSGLCFGLRRAVLGGGDGDEKLAGWTGWWCACFFFLFHVGAVWNFVKRVGWAGVLRRCEECQIQ